MKLLLDMNISPKLADMLNTRQINTKHWCKIGSYTAADTEIMAYAREKQYTVVTYDLDFAAILSATQGTKPSVIQVRKHGLCLDILAELLATAVCQWAGELREGAVLILDTKKS